MLSLYRVTASDLTVPLMSTDPMEKWEVHGTA